MKDKPKEEIFRKGQALSVPVAQVNTAEDVVASPHFNARGFFVEVDHPVMGKMEKFPSSPYRFFQNPLGDLQAGTSTGRAQQTDFL